MGSLERGWKKAAEKAVIASMQYEYNYPIIYDLTCAVSLRRKVANQKHLFPNSLLSHKYATQGTKQEAAIAVQLNTQFTHVSFSFSPEYSTIETIRFSRLYISFTKRRGPFHTSDVSSWKTLAALISVIDSLSWIALDMRNSTFIKCIIRINYELYPL